MVQCPKCGLSRVYACVSNTCEMCGYPLLNNNQTEGRSYFRFRGIPWENIKTIGMVKALLHTILECALKPSRFFGQITKNSSLFHALLFGLCAGSIGIIFDVLWKNSTGDVWNRFSELSLNQDFNAINAQSLIYSPFSLSLHIFLLSLYAHLFLTLTGGKHGSFKSTVITACYTQSVAVLSVIPYVGNIVSPFWALWLLIVGISSVHKISIARSTAALLLPLIIIVLLCSFIIIALMGSGILLSVIFKDFLPFFR